MAAVVAAAAPAAAVVVKEDVAAVVPVAVLKMYVPDLAVADAPAVSDLAAAAAVLALPA